jgi:hypothetical protein
MHVFIWEILANMTQVSDVAPWPLVFDGLFLTFSCKGGFPIAAYSF